MANPEASPSVDKARHSLWNPRPNWRESLAHLPRLTEEQIEELAKRLQEIDLYADPEFQAQIASLRSPSRMTPQERDTVIGGPNSGLDMGRPICGPDLRIPLSERI